MDGTKAQAVLASGIIAVGIWVGSVDASLTHKASDTEVAVLQSEVKDVKKDVAEVKGDVETIRDIVIQIRAEQVKQANERKD